MVLIESTPSRDTVLQAVHDGLAALAEAGLDAHAILVGPEAFEHLRKATGAQFGRGAGYFETYQHVLVVVDPQRGGRLLVVPSPREVAAGVRVETY